MKLAVVALPWTDQVRNPEILPLVLLLDQQVAAVTGGGGGMGVSLALGGAPATSLPEKDGPHRSHLCTCYIKAQLLHHGAASGDGTDASAGTERWHTYAGGSQ